MLLIDEMEKNQSPVTRGKIIWHDGGTEVCPSCQSKGQFKGHKLFKCDGNVLLHGPRSAPFSMPITAALTCLPLDHLLRQAAEYLTSPHTGSPVQVGSPVVRSFVTGPGPVPAPAEPKLTTFNVTVSLRPKEIHVSKKGAELASATWGKTGIKVAVGPKPLLEAALKEHLANDEREFTCELPASLDPLPV